MTTDPASIARAVLRGDLARADVERLATAHWAAADFFLQAPAHAVGDALVGVPGRYGPCDRLSVQVLYGAPGEAGCLLIDTPRTAPWDRTMRSFLVPPHVHDSGHITVVTRGRAVFLVVRDGTLVVVHVEPGSIVLYPAHVPHTFASDEAFQVASLQAAFHDPAGKRFSQPAPVRIHELPRMAWPTARDVPAAESAWS